MRRCAKRACRRSFPPVLTCCFTSVFTQEHNTRVQSSGLRNDLGGWRKLKPDGTALTRCVLHLPSSMQLTPRQALQHSASRGIGRLLQGAGVTNQNTATQSWSASVVPSEACLCLKKPLFCLGSILSDPRVQNRGFQAETLQGPVSILTYTCVFIWSCLV